MERDICQLAKNLATNCGYHVFPCAEGTKMPCWSKEQGGKGFYDASTDPAEIERLFAHRNAKLIAIRAGKTSRIAVLDIDIKHEKARAWWIKNESRLPSTRTFRTRGGGLHLFFQHADGVRNSEGIPIKGTDSRLKGVDSRGEGGYVVFWFAAGFECLDHSPPAPWPGWLTTLFWPPVVVKEKARTTEKKDENTDAEIERIKQRAIDRVRDAGDGEVHNRLRSSAKLLGGIQNLAGFTDAEAVEWLAGEIGLEGEKKAIGTIKWGLEKGRAAPLELGARR